MPSISLQTEITLDQLYQLIAQLKPKDKVSLAKKLRAEFALEQWLAISKKTSRYTRNWLGRNFE